MSGATAAAAAAAALQGRRSNQSGRSSSMQQKYYYDLNLNVYGAPTSTSSSSSRYSIQKERDWNIFNEYRMNHKPVPLTLRNCSCEHVLEFLGRQTLDHDELGRLVGRLGVAFEENGGRPATNPFKAPLVRLYLRQHRINY